LETWSGLLEIENGYEEVDWRVEQSQNPSSAVQHRILTMCPLKKYGEISLEHGPWMIYLGGTNAERPSSQELPEQSSPFSGKKSLLPHLNSMGT
jgi:hypothetical protein